MKRRGFITLLGSAALCALATRAQHPIHPYARVFVHALRDLGYVENRNLILERRSAEGKFERFPEIVRELIDNKVDVIVTVTDPMARAAKEVTHTVPIVAITTDPIERGLI